MVQLGQRKSKNLDSRLKISGMTNENCKGVSPPYNPPGKRKTKDKNFKTKITEEERTFLSGLAPPHNPPKTKEKGQK